MGGVAVIASQDLISIDWTFVAELIAWLILLYVMVRLLYNPLTRAMAARAERIRSELGAAEQAARAAQDAEQRTKAEIDRAKSEGAEILRQANVTAAAMREQMVNEARTEAQRVIDRGKAEIERERQAAIDDLRRTVGELAIQAASQ